MEIKVGERIFSRNEQQADVNRNHFQAAGVMVLNMIGSPGCGKTTLLKRTLTDLKSDLSCAVIEGDVETDLDVQELSDTGASIRLINTHGACHLDAAGIAQVSASLPLDELNLLIIENIGNLVCPAAFDLGEHAKVAVLSTPEGHEKPEKYPNLFTRAACVLITKIEMAEVAGFDLHTARRGLQRCNPDITILPISAVTGAGWPGWLDWIRSQHTRIVSRQ